MRAKGAGLLAMAPLISLLIVPVSDFLHERQYPPNRPARAELRAPIKDTQPAPRQARQQLHAPLCPPAWRTRR